MVSAQRDAPVEIALAELRPGALTGEDDWAGYAAGVAWAIAERGHRLPGLSISVDGDVPAGAGLSSSAALECSVAARAQRPAAAWAWTGRSWWRWPGRPRTTSSAPRPAAWTSWPRSSASATGCCCATCARWRSSRSRFDLEAAGLTLLVIDTKAPHQLTDGLYGERRSACEQAARLLGVPALRDLGLEDLSEAMDRLPDETLRRRARHVITENDRTLACADLLRTGQLRRIGPLLTASHASMRDDFEITVPEVDLAVEVLLAFGALRRPDDRRRLRRLRDRADGSGTGPGRRAGGAGRLCRPGLHRTGQLHRDGGRRRAPG